MRFHFRNESQIVSVEFQGCGFTDVIRWDFRLRPITVFPKRLTFCSRFFFKQILRSNLAFIFEGLVYFEVIWFDQKRGFSSKSAWVFQGVRRKINVSPYQCHVLRKRQGVCLLRTHGTSCVILYSYQFAKSRVYLAQMCRRSSWWLLIEW